jgi:hypothetical protein
VRVRGQFSADVGKEPMLRLEERLVPAPQLRTVADPSDTASMMAALAEMSVAAFQPITVWGQLDTGQAITVLDARSSDTGQLPQYIGQAVVFDANVSPDELYSALRFHVGHPWWLRHLTDGESAVVDDDQSTLSVEALESHNWLVYESTNAVTLRQLEMRVISGCLALMYLALHPDRDLLAACETQVRRDPDGPWLSVSGPAYSAESGAFQADTLLQAQDLTIQRFADWIPLNDRLDGLGWAVAEPMKVAVQAQTQVLTSLVEGLHRRLPSTFEQSYFPPSVPKAALKRVRKAAWEAAATQARQEQIDGLDPELVGELVRKAVGHVGDKSFRDRAEEVVAEVQRAVPEIAESVAGLPVRLTDPRHSFAHQLPQAQAKEPLEDRWRHWTAVSRITPWLLRALLLLDVGIDPHYLHERSLEHEQFAFFRENTAQLVRELGWDLPEDEPEPEPEDDCCGPTESSCIERRASRFPIPGSSWLARRARAFIACSRSAAG